MVRSKPISYGYVFGVVQLGSFKGNYLKLLDEDETINLDQCYWWQNMAQYLIKKSFSKGWNHDGPLYCIEALTAPILDEDMRKQIERSGTLCSKETLI